MKKEIKRTDLNDKTFAAPSGWVAKNRRQLTHGSLAAAITALVIAFIIVFNIAFTALSRDRMWYFDMTKEQLYTVSDGTKEILSDVTSEVKVIFTRDESELTRNVDLASYFTTSTDVSDEAKLMYIYHSAKLLEKEFPFLHVECVDVVKYPGYFDSYYSSLADNIKTTDVIIDGPASPRKLSCDSFFVYDPDNAGKIWAYNGESKFAETILEVTSSDRPAVAFTTGHGETPPDDAAAFRDLCSLAGYDVREIDLAKEDIDADVRILVINDPVYDLSGFEGKDTQSEIDKVARFLDEYGCVMVFAGSERAKNLTNLAELLLEWGIELCPGEVVKDTANSITYDGLEIYAEYYGEDTLGAELYSSISSLSSMPKTVMPGAMPLNMLYDTNSELFGVFAASPVLKSSDSSRTERAGEVTDNGSRVLMSLTAKEGIIDNKDYVYAYLLVSGSPEMISDDHLNSAYGNRDIMFYALKHLGRQKVVSGIDLKRFDDTSLTASVGQINGWTVFFAAVIPVIAGVCGIVVCFRRRRR